MWLPAQDYYTNHDKQEADTVSRRGRKKESKKGAVADPLHDKLDFEDRRQPKFQTFLERDVKGIAPKALAIGQAPPYLRIRQLGKPRVHMLERHRVRACVHICHVSERACGRAGEHCHRCSAGR